MINIFYSDRKALANMFEKWAKENNACICSENVIAFLQICKILNEDKVKEVLENGK